MKQTLFPHLGKKKKQHTISCLLPNHFTDRKSQIKWLNQVTKTTREQGYPAAQNFRLPIQPFLCCHMFFSANGTSGKVVVQKREKVTVGWNS